MWTQTSWPQDIRRKLVTGELVRESCLHMNPDCYRAYMQVTHTAPSSERCAQLQEYNQCYLTKPPFDFKLSSCEFGKKTTVKALHKTNESIRMLISKQFQT